MKGDKKTMNIRKLSAMALAAAMAVTALAGCGEKAADESASNGAAGDKTYKIGLCQLVQHDALDKATEGFQDTLKEKLGDNVEFDLQNAAGDSATCATITNSLFHQTMI